MDFKSFVRQVGGASSDPLLGSDLPPSGSASKGASCAFNFRTEGDGGVPVLQRLALSYAGPAAIIPVIVYLFDEASETWIITSGGSASVSSAALTKVDLLTPISGSADVYIQAVDPGGLGNGVYEFLVAPDGSSAPVTIAAPIIPANVNVLNFPGNQPVTVLNTVQADVTDRAARLVGKVGLQVAGADVSNTNPVVVRDPTTTTISSLPDTSVTTAPAALAALAAGPTGILVTAHPYNTAPIRVSGSDVTTTRGQPLQPGASFLFSVTNANQLSVAAETGTQTLCASAV